MRHDMPNGDRVMIEYGSGIQIWPTFFSKPQVVISQPWIDIHVDNIWFVDSTFWPFDEMMTITAMGSKPKQKYDGLKTKKCSLVVLACKSRMLFLCIKEPAFRPELNNCIIYLTVVLAYYAHR